ncbi:hypothetical protein GCM10022631_16710 [Deinococcus rubellus]|uniref:CvpA family protein n=1 Tax=Deinococcus rubellus TaxID=1889240 RepID=A0ABY5YHK2_9DEIO|nr:hypothetical protein [Deinococcus rubellus]UWX64589.1 hypothetical protein N0D28_02690 [Deinococcus rubellus]
MITWFDALLVTLLAATTALGARRGLAGLAWGVGIVAVCFVCNALLSGWVALPAALLLGFGVAWLARRLVGPVIETWHLAVGAVGGFLAGLVLVGSLALGFPIDPVSNQYPAGTLPPSIHDAVVNSYLKQELFPVFGSKSALRTLLIPDFNRR